jgi:hypothetical protein
MVHIPFKVKGVESQFILGFLNERLLFQIIWIFGKLFELVTFVIASCGTSMLFPGG